MKMAAWLTPRWVTWSGTLGRIRRARRGMLEIGEGRASNVVAGRVAENQGSGAQRVGKARLIASVPFKSVPFKSHRAARGQLRAAFAVSLSIQKLAKQHCEWRRMLGHGLVIELLYAWTRRSAENERNPTCFYGCANDLYERLSKANGITNANEQWR